MTNRTLTALIVRLAGFALFVKIFDFLGSYFMSIYMSTQITLMEQPDRLVDSFNKLYFAGTFIFFANIILSLFLILKAGWIGNKLIKNETEIKIDLPPTSVMRIVIATIGIIYCAKTLFYSSTTFDKVVDLINWNNNESYSHLITGLINYLVRAILGIVFIFKSEQLANFAMKKIRSDKQT